MARFLTALCLCISLAGCKTLPHPQGKTESLTNRRGIQFQGEILGLEGTWLHIQAKDGQIFTVSIENFIGSEREKIVGSAKGLKHPPGKGILTYEGADTHTKDGMIYLKGTSTPVTGRILMRRGNQLAAKLSCYQGQLHGVCTYWDETGMRKAEVEFGFGKKHGISIHWQGNGKLLSRAYYYDGKLDGILEEYYAGGAKKSRSEWHYGVPSGKREEWHPNGHKARQVSYQGGSPWSIMEWNDTGSLTSMDRRPAPAPQ